MAQYTPQHVRQLFEYEKNCPPPTARALNCAFGPDWVVKADAGSRTTTTLTPDQDLSVNVIANTPYLITARLYLTAPAGGGIKVDLAGGTAVASIVRGTGVFTLAAGASPVTVDLTALNTAQAPAAAAYVSYLLTATVVFSSPGTFMLQYAQATASGTTTVNSGSSLSCEPLLLMNTR